MSEQLLRIGQIATILDVSEGRAYELVRNGTIPSVRLGRQVRVDPAALETWIAAGGKGLLGGWRKCGGTNSDRTAVDEGQG